MKNVLNKPPFLRTALATLLLVSLQAPLTATAQPLDTSADRGRELLEAVKAAETERALVLLDGVREVDHPEPDGMTPLHYAVLNNDLTVTQALLRAGADVNARTRYEVSPIYLAAQNGSAEMTRLLLDNGANANEVYREGERVLHTAARTGNPDTVKVLLDAGAEIDAREEWHGQTALMWAVAQQHAALVPLLVERGANVNAISALEVWERQITDEPREKWLPPGGMNALMFAAREGCLSCIEPLLDAGASIDAATPKGITPLLGAIINGHYDVAWLLVEKGANVNLNDDTNRSPLYAAVHFNIMPESNRPSPYDFENEHSAYQLAELLLDKGADVNVQLKALIPFRAKLDRGTDSMLVAGTTPFLRAAKSADLPMMKLLLEHGADPKLTTSQGIDALMTAANLATKESDTTGRYKTQAEVIEAIKLCQSQGLDVNAKANDGRTAIFGAATFGLTEVVQYLHQQGAELDYVDAKGLSPLDAAMGKAGGFGFQGTDGRYWDETIALIESLL
jgi:ankyrin repeat protein